MAGKMKVEIETDGTISGTTLVVDGKQVPHIQAFSFTASVVRGVHFDLRYYGDNGGICGELATYPMVSLRAFDKDASAKLAKCRSAWQSLSGIAPLIMRTNIDYRILDSVLLGIDCTDKDAVE